MRYSLDKPVLTVVRPHMCHWCSGRLNQLRHIFKGQNSERLYCGEKCLIRGEERVQNYKNSLNSAVYSRWYVAVAGIIAILMLAFAATPKARAHEHEGVNYSDWHNSNGTSCCNDADCQPTTAYMEDDGDWYAMFEGRKVRIPMDRVLHMPSPDGRSHICMSPEATLPYCFVAGEIRS